MNYLIHTFVIKFKSFLTYALFSKLDKEHMSISSAGNIGFVFSILVVIIGITILYLILRATLGNKT